MLWCCCFLTFLVIQYMCHGGLSWESNSGLVFLWGGMLLSKNYPFPWVWQNNAGMVSLIPRSKPVFADSAWKSSAIPSPLGALINSCLHSGFLAHDFIHSVSKTKLAADAEGNSFSFPQGTWCLHLYSCSGLLPFRIHNGKNIYIINSASRNASIIFCLRPTTG